ncbi:cardiac-enriched FHL2-interacting protein [Oreochromis aureus]|uniref:cardiac-enriched FHL2-interacting protein n=1 Tax=Oreochromis aureus TaxID=47969 RepID=UPI0019537EDE|nr:cardiac-enriched FHL2-interacting protein [Oreochromis aureus]
MTSVEKRRSCRKSGGHRRHSDGGYSDTSSGGSFLDENDREVCSLTDRAFRSLCIGDEAVYNDSDLSLSSPCSQRDRQLAFSQSGQDREDGEREELKRAARENFSLKVQQYGQDWSHGRMYGGEIHRDPQWEVYGERTQGRISATFQHSVVETSQKEKSLKEERLNFLSNGATELSSQQRKSNSRVSSLIRAFNSERHRDGVGMDDKIREWKDDTSWDKSALMSIQRELSEFSSYQQNFHSGHFPSSGPFSYGDTNLHSFGSDVAAVSHSSASSFMRSSHNKQSMFTQVSCNSNVFIHSEFSPFKVWRDHNRFPFQQGQISGFMHCSEFAKWYETPMYKEPSQMGQPQGHYTGIRQPRSNLAPMISPALPRSTSTSTVLQNASAVKKRCESELAGHYPHRKRSQSVGTNRLPSHRPSTASPTIEMSRRVRDTISSVKALQHKIKMMTEQNITTEVTENQQTVLYRNENVSLGNNAVTVAPNTIGSNTSATPFNISQLLTPLVHAHQEAVSSDLQHYATSPQPVEHPPVRAESRGATPDIRMSTYKSRATSLLFNLKDNRKRVKSTYSPTKFKAAETPEKNKQPPTHEPRDTVIDIPEFPDSEIQFSQLQESSRTSAAMNQYRSPELSLTMSNSQPVMATTGQYVEYSLSDYQRAQMQAQMVHHSGFTGFLPENYTGNKLANGQNLHEDLASFAPYRQDTVADRSNRELHKKSNRGKLHKKSSKKELHKKSNRGKLHKKSSKKELHKKSNKEELCMKSNKEELHKKSNKEELRMKSNKEELCMKSNKEKLHKKSNKEELRMKKQQRKAAQEEQQRRAVEEQQRRAAQEEQQRRAAQEEQQRRAAQDEQQRRAVHEEQLRIAQEKQRAAEELKRRAAQEEQQRKTTQEKLQRAAEEELQMKAAQREQQRRAVQEIQQRKRAALIEEQRQIEEKILANTEADKKRKPREGVKVMHISEEEMIEQIQIEEQKRQRQKKEEWIRTQKREAEMRAVERVNIIKEDKQANERPKLHENSQEALKNEMRVEKEGMLAQRENNIKANKREEEKLTADSEKVRDTRREQKRAAQVDALQYYAITSTESETKQRERQLCSPSPSQQRNNLSENESTESHGSHTRPHAPASPAPSLPRSNTSSPALGVKPLMFRVKDNTFRGSTSTKSVKPRFYKSFGEDFRVGSPSDRGLEKREEEQEKIRHSAGTPVQHHTGLNRLTAISESSTFQSASSPQDHSAPIPHYRPFSRRSIAMEEDDSRSLISNMSEDVESFATSAADLADIRGLYDNERPESACSFSSDVSRSLGKPPAVPPKSEKALRRAQRLTTRRMKKELSKVGADSLSGVEKDVSTIRSSSSTEVRSSNRHAMASPHFSSPVSLANAPVSGSSLPSTHTEHQSSHHSFHASPHATGPISIPHTAAVSLPGVSHYATGPASHTAVPKTVAHVPSSPTFHQANHPAPVTQYHVESSYPQAYPLTQRKVLQDPGSGQYFVVDLPVQVKKKTFFDPQTGKYVQLNVRESGKSISQPQPQQTCPQPQMQIKSQQQPFSQTFPAGKPFVLYQGYPQHYQPPSINSLHPNKSQVPATLHQNQQPGCQAFELGQNSEGHRYSPEKTPYMDTVNDKDKTYNTIYSTHGSYESFPECDTNSQLAGSSVCENDNSAHSQHHPRDIIAMSELDDFMEVSDW